MGGIGSRVPVRLIGLAFGLAAVTGSVALVGTRNTAYVTTYGGVSAFFGLLEASTGVALLAAALLLLFERSGRVLALLTSLTSIVWFAPVWVGWDGGPAIARSLGLVAAPLLAPLVLAVAAWLPPAPPRGVRAIALLALASTAALSLLVAAVRDPIRDLYCWSDCATNVFLVHDDAVLARHLTLAALGMDIACGVLATIVCLVGVARTSHVTRHAVGPALGAGALAGLALAAYAGALAYDPRELPRRPLYEVLFVGRAWALLLFAAGLGWVAVRPVLVRRHVARLAIDLERTTREGGLAQALATALGDPTLRIGYPIGPSGRVVDADGHVLALDPGRVTTIVGSEGEVALVESDIARSDVLERELGPAARLALGNERLRAEALTRLADAQSSRLRTVETADAARRRMERDLHDGAQQRMLALTYDLRVALEIAESSGDSELVSSLREALERASTTSHDLREVAHGIFPAELTVSGLEAALELLADERPLALSIDLPSGPHYSRALAATAYAVVVEATEDAGLAGVAATEVHGSLRLVIDADVEWADRLVRLEDRVAVVGGSVRRSGRRLEAIFPLGLSA